MENLLAVCVHSGGIQDRHGARLLMIRLCCRKCDLGGWRLQRRFSRMGEKQFNWNLTIVKRKDTMLGKFVVLPRRRSVERSF